MNALNGLGWVDLTLLALLGVSVLIGLARGLVFELMSLVGWVVAYVVAQAYSQIGRASCRERVYSSV